MRQLVQALFLLALIGVAVWLWLTGPLSAREIQLTAHSPFHDRAELKLRMGWHDSDLGRADEYRVQEESYILRKPRALSPHGLLVWLGNGETGEPPPEYYPVLNRRNLIWASPNRAGQTRSAAVRLELALDVASDVLRTCSVDKQRVYVGGYSSGSRCASRLAFKYPEVFGGALLAGGSLYYRNLGPHWKAAFPPPLHMGEVLSDHFVLLMGERDPALPEANAVYQAMQKDGFKSVDILVVPGMGPESPQAEAFAQALEKLEPR